MSNEQMRADFEAWFATEDFGPNGLRQIDAKYVHAPAATFWRVWQAATLKAAEAGREELLDIVYGYANHLRNDEAFQEIIRARGKA